MNISHKTNKRFLLYVSIFLSLMYICMCLCVGLHMCEQCSQCPEEGARCPGTGVTCGMDEEALGIEVGSQG